MLPVVLHLVGLLALQAPAATSVFVVQLDARGGVTRDDAEQVGGLLAVELSRVPGLRVLTAADAETLLTAEARAQLLACDSAGCLAQIAGALNTDEIVSGSLGRVGGDAVLMLSRVRTRDAIAVARVAEPLGNAGLDATRASVARAVAQLYPPPSAPAVAVPIPAVKPHADPAPQNPAPPPVTAPAPAAAVDDDGPHPLLALAGNVGALAWGTVPLTLLGVVAMAALVVTSPVGMLAALLLGVQVSTATGEGQLTDMPRTLSAAAVVFPGAWFLVAAVVSAALLGMHAVVPAGVRLLAGRTSLPSVSPVRWMLAPLFGALTGSVAFVPAALAALAGATLLASIAVGVDVQNPGAGRSITSDAFALQGLAGLGLCVLAFVLAGAGFLLVNVGTLGSALVLLASRGGSE